MGRLKIGVRCTQGDPGEGKVKVKTQGKLKRQAQARCVYSILKNKELHKVASGQRVKKYDS
jgi:hypothetical protein